VTGESDFVVIGLLRRAHGVRGDLSVQAVSDVPERFDSLERVLVRQGGSIRELAVESVRWKNRSLLLKFQGIDDRTAAEALKGAEIGVRKRDVHPVPDGTYYVFDLVGCKVIGKDDREIGRIDEVMKMPANDVFSVKTGSGEVLIPVVADVVKEIDLERKVVRIEEIEGLLG
jgi:16S rRNA processing protein RimM